MRKIIISIILTLTCACAIHADVRLDKLYENLDSLLRVKGEIIKNKAIRIEAIKSALAGEGLTDVERYNINERLYNEYAALKYDSAFKYIEKNVELSVKMNDMTRYNRSLLGKVHILAVSGLFDEADNILQTIDPSKLHGDDLVEYYSQNNDMSIFKAEFANGTQYYNSYIDKAMAYRRLILDKASNKSYIYAFTKASYVCQMGRYDEAISILLRYLPRLRPGDRRYSILTSTLAYFYMIKNNSESRHEYLIRSAMSDIEGGILENNSMRELSSLLFKDGEIDRAYQYISISIEDANSYGTRLRNSQAAQLIPLVISAYQTKQDAQRRHTMTFLTITMGIALLLIIALVVIVGLVKRYRRANSRVSKMNAELNVAVSKLGQTNKLMQEANNIKEEYIGRFLELSSVFIDKADEQRKVENRMAREHNLQELYAELKSGQFIADNTRLFYQNFDSAFLNIYSNFVEEVNKLLERRAQITPKAGERLSTELRILALIRLGITDNQKIAGILRSSITTIYTYRSKLKARAVDKESFEELIKKIDSYVS